ncbi:hypothetical protein [Ralstonia sp. ASV6]|uniref:hypothetical protein n=1 Tax=Ralstonia sp. ASV6 TaxID=2795124 RepID=UPI0018EB0466|nr:hypothetical protein [Ralstonia sp. ASV6]
MRAILPLLAFIAIPTAAAQTVSTCKINGKTVITDKPCDRAMEATIEFGTPTERALKQQREEQRKSNCAQLSRSRADAQKTAAEHSWDPRAGVLMNTVIKQIDEQLSANHC